MLISNSSKTMLLRLDTLRLLQRLAHSTSGDLTVFVEAVKKVFVGITSCIERGQMRT